MCLKIKEKVISNVSEYVKALYQENTSIAPYGQMLTIPAENAPYAALTGKFKVSWNSDDLESITDEIISVIDRIYDSVSGISSQDDVNAFVSKFITPVDTTILNSFNVDPEMIFLKEYDGEVLSTEEEEYNKKEREIYETEAKKRLGDNDYSCYILVRSLRFKKLVELEAHELVLIEEAKQLALAMVLHAFSIQKDVQK